MIFFCVWWSESEVSSSCGFDVFSVFVYKCLVFFSLFWWISTFVYFCNIMLWSEVGIFLDLNKVLNVFDVVFKLLFKLWICVRCKFIYEFVWLMRLLYCVNVVLKLFSVICASMVVIKMGVGLFMFVVSILFKSVILCWVLFCCVN